MLSATLLPDLALVNVSLTICAVLPVRWRLPGEQGAEAAMWVERFHECVADDKQGNYRNKEVRGDHQGEVLAVDFVEPPDGFERKRHPPMLLQLLLDTGARS